MTTQPRTAAGRALSRAWRVRRTASPGLEEAWPEQFDRYILAIEAEAATPALDVDLLVDIIEQAIFETSTGLEAALLASERITAAYTPRLASADEDKAKVAKGIEDVIGGLDELMP